MIGIVNACNTLIGRTSPLPNVEMGTRCWAKMATTHDRTTAAARMERSTARTVSRSTVTGSANPSNQAAF